MIGYETQEKFYQYKMEDLEHIIEMLENIEEYTQESVLSILDAIDQFLSNIQEEERVVTRERHETEEEAREYFGQEFIDQFDSLLTRLDQEDTFLAIHGTSPANCEDIIQKGLEYANPRILSTAIIQDMAYQTEEMHYSEYETLLNWPHRHHKGLVLIAIPYECHYKEGLWEHFRDENNAAYGIYDYRINPEFIVGYIDVEKKQIVLNPNYHRNHDYSNTVNDYDICKFKMQNIHDNDQFRELCIQSKKEMEEWKQEHQTFKREDSSVKEKEVDMREAAYAIQSLMGEFNSIKLAFPEEMSEERYKKLLDSLSYKLTDIKKAVPLFKTEEEVKREEEERKAFFDNLPKDDGDEDWDDFEWETADDSWINNDIQFH